MRLRSVELELVDVPQAADFLERVWGLLPAGSSGAARFWRGSGDHPYILSVSRSGAAAVGSVTFSGTADEIAKLGKPSASYDVPGGGKGLEIRGPEAQNYRFIVETSRPAAVPDKDKPIQLTHAVINSTDVEA